MKKNILLSLCLLMFSGTTVFAHGIQVESSFQYPQATVKFHFSKSSPVANANVSVYYFDTEELYISGTTDKNGVFVFMPDAPGKWTLKIDDGMGHRKTEVITIDDEMFESDTPVEPIKSEEDNDCAHAHGHDDHHHHDHCHIPMIYKIIFGLAIMFGITGIWYGLKARKK